MEVGHQGKLVRGADVDQQVGVDQPTPAHIPGESSIEVHVSVELVSHAV